MIKQPVKIAIANLHDFQDKSQYFKARKDASKRGNRLLRHRYKQLLPRVDMEEFTPLVISSVFG